MSVKFFNNSVKIPTPTDGGSFNASEREQLRDVTTTGIATRLVDPSTKPGERKQLVDELQDRLKQDPDMPTATREEMENILKKADKGPITDDQKEKLMYALPYTNAGELKEDGIADDEKLQWRLMSREEIRDLPTTQLLNFSLNNDLTPEKRKTLVDELQDRAKMLDLTPAEQGEVKDLLSQIEKGGGQAIPPEKLDRLEQLLPARNNAEVKEDQDNK